MSNDKNIVTKTNDGYVVELFAKAKKNCEIDEVAEGISILDLIENKTENELYSIYKELVDRMDYNPVIIKVPDMDKGINPLKTQLRAILRVANEGDLSIVFSKVSTVMELKEYKDILEECKNELEVEKIPYKKHIKVGTIIEIPSAALMTYGIARECDLIYIDVDSLTSYTFATKKENCKKPELYTKIQPGIIKLIQHAKSGAHDAGIFCGICGEVVERELYIPLLIGLGLDQFTIDSKNITKTRKIISELDKSDCKELVEEILKFKEVEDIENKIKQFIQK